VKDRPYCHAAPANAAPPLAPEVESAPVFPLRQVEDDVACLENVTMQESPTKRPMDLFSPSARESEEMRLDGRGGKRFRPRRMC